MAIDFPNTPSLNQQYTVGDRTWTWNGTFWQVTGTSSTFTASDAPPSGPSVGDFWFESDSGKTFVYYDSYWIEIGSTAASMDAGNLSGNTLASGVTASSLTSVGTLGSLTITGDMAVDTNTLKVDSTNNRVGVATTSPAYPLDVTGTAQATAFLQGTDYMTPYTGFRNAIINGDFRINQRGWSSSTTSGIYGFDRWVQSNVGGTVTMSSQSFTVGSPAATGYESATYCRLAISGQSGTDFASVSQRIEDVRTFSGSPVTVSFWAKASSGTPKVGIELGQYFGTGGSPSAEVNNALGAVTISTSWQRYSISMTLPSLSGKTLGTTANTNLLNLILWCSSGSTYATRASNIGIQNNTFDFWGVQVERGSVATPFEQRPIGTELALCQRYFQLINSYVTDGDFNVMMVRETATQAQATIWLPVTMRATPSLYGSTYGRCVFRDTSFNVAVASVSSIAINATGPSKNAITLIITHGSTGGTYVYNEWDMYNTSANLGLSAEL